MPPITPVNQGSRAAIITWTVVSSILFVTATVFAIYFYVAASRVTDEATKQNNQYKDIIALAQLSGSDVVQAQAARTAPEAAIYGINGQMTVVDVLTQQRKGLAKKIAGSASENDSFKTIKAADDAIKSAADKVKAGGTTLPTAGSLVDTVNTLANNLAARQQEVENLQGQLKAANNSLKSTIDATQQQIAEMTKTIEGIRGEQAKAVSETTSVGSTKDDQIKALQDQMKATEENTQKAQNQFQVQISDLSKQLESSQRERDQARERLNQVRIDVNKPILRQPDGHITRLPGGAVCFIDLGAGQQIAPGLTFEVYDKIEGIPPAGDHENDDNLPKGKASIEVVRVGPASSECRITRREAGSTLTEGDLIANLVYDPNTKNHFFVYGSFDMDNDGRFTPEEGRRDAEVVKRLITQWGGAVTNDVNVDTDFVILGKEPQVPSFTKADLDDPINKAKYDAAVADAQSYDEIKIKAQALRIPILNQNRFLYLVGYYDRATR